MKNKNRKKEAKTHENSLKTKAFKIGTAFVNILFRYAIRLNSYLKQFA
jgi:hypothetical protein